ncbi:Rv0361 family membrane protein [Nocardia brasiliensis]
MTTTRIVSALMAAAAGVLLTGCADRSPTPVTAADNTDTVLRAAYTNFLNAYNAQDLDGMAEASCASYAEILREPDEGQSPNDLLAKDFAADGPMILDSFTTAVRNGDTATATTVSHYANDEKNGAVLPNPPVRQNFTKESGVWKICQFKASER